MINNVDEEVKPLSGKAQSAFEDVGNLAQHVDAKVDPLTQALTEALESADAAFKSIDEITNKSSPTRAELDNVLIEIAGAARSVRILAEYLEQHPEALLKGKAYKNY